MECTNSERYTRWDIHTDGIYTGWKHIHGEAYKGWSVQEYTRLSAHKVECTRGEFIYGGTYTRRGHEEGGT